MIAIKCLDTSAWLAYFFGESLEVRNFVESEVLLITSSLSLFELKKKFLLLKKDPLPFLDFVKSRSQIITPDIIIAEQAADLTVQRKIGAMDALIYATSAAHHAELVTGDNDFRGLSGVFVLA